MNYKIVIDGVEHNPMPIDPRSMAYHEPVEPRDALPGEIEIDGKNIWDVLKQHRANNTEMTFIPESEPVKARLANAPEMEFSDKDTWDMFVTIMPTRMNLTYFPEYARRWARLMQLELQKGKTLEEVCDDMFEEAGLPALESYDSLFEVTSILRKTWVHGVELDRIYWGDDNPA